LREQLRELQATVQRLQEELAAARKNSATSSKPPSSDLVKPPKTPAADPTTGRQRGGQPGHAPQQRPLLPAEQLTATHSYRLEHCPKCGSQLQATPAAPRVIQQVEIHTVPITVEEHRGLPGWCPCCQRLRYGPWPVPVERGGMVGPRLATLIAYLKGVCHASFSTIRKFLRDVLRITICRGQLAKIIGKVTQALQAPYEQLLEELPDEPSLNVDETGHKDNGERWWTWCFRADLYTLFHIDPLRSADVLIDILGREFQGVLGCDYFSAYRRYMGECDVVVQFCLAHLIRDVKFLMTLPDHRDRAYGERLREGLRQLFVVIHQRAQLPGAVFRRQLQVARDQVLRLATREVPATRASQNLAQRFRAHGEAYFRFVTTPGVEPTNNLAEQAIRFVVIDRHITQGTRSEAGRQWCERIWTVMATCSQQGRSVFAYLYAAVHAYFHRSEAPSLLPEEN
jgi:transposase